MNIQPVGMTTQKSNRKMDYNPNFTATFGIYNRSIYNNLSEDAVKICRAVAEEHQATSFQKAKDFFGGWVCMTFNNEKDLKVLADLHNRLNLSTEGIVKTQR